MGKDATPTKLKPNQSTATAKFVRIPPRKARLVVDAVRGKYVVDALAILKFVPNFAARAIEDVIKSAVANAESGRPNDPATGKPMDPLVAENLKLVRAMINEGPRLKRVQPRAQGRMYRILKRMSHITVILEESAPKPRPVKKRATTRRQRATEPKAAVQPPVEDRTAAVAPVEEVTEVRDPETIVTGEVETPVVTEPEAEAGVAGEVTAGSEVSEAEAITAVDMPIADSAEANEGASEAETVSVPEQTDAAEDAPGSDEKNSEG